MLERGGNLARIFAKSKIKYFSKVILVRNVYQYFLLLQVLFEKQKTSKNNQNNQNNNQKYPQICDVWKVLEQIDKLIGSIGKRQNWGVSGANFGNCFYLFLCYTPLSIFFG